MGFDHQKAPLAFWRLRQVPVPTTTPPHPPSLGAPFMRQAFTAATTDWAHGLAGGDQAVARITHNVLDRLSGGETG